MGGNYRRHVVAYADYFKDFKRSLDKASVARIYQTFLYVMTFDKIPAKFFRSITSVKGLYEIRVEYESNIYRTGSIRSLRKLRPNRLRGRRK